jgi:hypothetical protein
LGQLFCCCFFRGYGTKKNHSLGRKEIGMNLKAKVYVENQKKKVQESLNARVARLKKKGLKEDMIQKDATVRKLKAQVRKADYRLASIAAQEKLNQERAQAKMDKLAAVKAAQEIPQPDAEKGAPEKKEKKAKKEKQDKQAKPEEKAAGKKEKKEKQDKPKKAPEKEEGP